MAPRKSRLVGAAGVQFQHDFESALAELSEENVRQFRFQFNRQREMYLDECHGGCVLRSPRLSAIVAESLLHFDGTRYRMGDFVVMPNHVHVLVAIADAEVMRKQFASWLHYTAHQINRALARSGHFWQEEPFDHLVRSPEQHEYLRTYIRNNPSKARLSPDECHYRKGP